MVGTDEATRGEGKDRSEPGPARQLPSPHRPGHGAGQPAGPALDLQSDGPVAIETYRPRFPAIVFSGYNGQSQGTALADVLFGKQNPGGHLNFTWYKDDSQLPADLRLRPHPEHTGGLGRTYQYFTGTPTYPFGYGLSYTDFAYSHVRAAAPRRRPRHGQRPLRRHQHRQRREPRSPSSTRPRRSRSRTGNCRRSGSSASSKTAVLRPGATEHITLTVRIPDLAFHDAQNKQVVPSGTYRFEVGLTRPPRPPRGPSGSP